MVMLTDGPGGDRPHPPPIRPQHHGATVAAGRPPVHGPVRRDGAEQLRPGRGGRGHRVDGRRRPGAPREAGRGRAGRMPGWTSSWWTRTAGASPTVQSASCWSVPPHGGRVRRRGESRRSGGRGGLRPHGRPCAGRSRGLRVDRGSHVGPHQPRREQGVPRAGGGGAAPRSPASPRPRSSPGRTIAWERSRSRCSSVTPTRRRSARCAESTCRPTRFPWPSTGRDRSPATRWASCCGARSSRICTEPSVAPTAELTPETEPRPGRSRYSDQLSSRSLRDG